MGEDVGDADELFDIFQAFGGLEVGGEAFLIAVDGMKEKGVTVDPEVLDREVAAGVTRLRPFDLNHTGAEVGQAESCRGSGEILAEFQYRQPV
jgi:hypothetical protein